MGARRLVLSMLGLYVHMGRRSGPLWASLGAAMCVHNWEGVLWASASQPAPQPASQPASQAQDKLVLSTLGLSGPLWASLGLSGPLWTSLRLLWGDQGAFWMTFFGNWGPSKTRLPNM